MTAQEWDPVDVSAVRAYEPEFSADEVIALLDFYQRAGKKNPVSFAINGKTKGNLRCDLESLRGGGDAAAPAALPEPRRIIITPASEIEPEAVTWLWNGRIPAAHVTMVAGREGIGKSLLVCDLAAKVTRGELDGVLQSIPSNVMYCTTEDSWSITIVPRLKAAGADLARVYRVDVQNANGSGGYVASELTLPRDIPLLAEKVRQHNVALIIIDPLMSATETSIDTHSDRETRAMLEPLGRLTGATGTSLIGITHFNKNGQQRDPLNLVMGSRAITAFARSVMAVARDPANGTGTGVITQVKNNLGTLDIPSLAYRINQRTITLGDGESVTTGKLDFIGNADRGVWEILSDTETAADRAENTDCAMWIRGELEKGPMKTKDLEAGGKAAGYSESTINRARRKIGVKSIRKDDAWWVELPATSATTSPDGV